MRTRERPAGELKDWAMVWEVVEEWAIVVLTLKKSDFDKFNQSELRLYQKGIPEETYSSNTQSSLASTSMMSGLVFASSL
jgi:hypothetical protein